MYTFKNNLKTILYEDLAIDATAIKCVPPISDASAEVRLGAWPEIGTDKSFILTLVDTTTKEFEIIQCTEVVENLSDYISFTIDRAKEDTVAKAFVVSDTSVEHRLTAEGINSFIQEVPSSTPTFGVIATDSTGNIVTDTGSTFSGAGRTSSANSKKDRWVADATEYGYDAKASTNGVAVGANAIAEYNCTAVGAGAQATAEDAIAIGYAAYATWAGISLGEGSSSTGRGIAVGDGAEAGGLNIAIGINAFSKPSSDSGVAIGLNAKTTHSYSTALGDSARTSKQSQVSIAELDADTHITEWPRLLSGVATPEVDQDAANKAYVDAAIAALRAELTA